MGLALSLGSPISGPRWGPSDPRNRGGWAAPGAFTSQRGPGEGSVDWHEQRIHDHQGTASRPPTSWGLRNHGISFRNATP